eukprot:TRINITY_DN4130_c2_g1_i1.p1 TRINITY_DN4130_c2_g1~~TRINITY_DN4130_c2_g1_i1.p1  ORF type:complete len:501 (+),score=102.35 TRINITY_DN4130_c2_g1_i1:77-1579(+)
MSEVRNILASISLDRYADVFKAAEISDWNTLVALTESDLRELVNTEKDLAKLMEKLGRRPATARTPATPSTPGIKRYDELLKKKEALLRLDAGHREIAEVEQEIEKVKRELGLGGDPITTAKKGDKVRVHGYPGCSEELTNIEGKIAIVSDISEHRYGIVTISLISNGKTVMVPPHCLQHVTAGRVRHTAHVKHASQQQAKDYTVHGHRTNQGLCGSRIHVTLALRPEVGCEKILSTVSATWMGKGLHQDTLQYTSTAHTVSFDVSVQPRVLEASLIHLDPFLLGRSAGKKSPFRVSPSPSSDLPNPSPSTCFTADSSSPQSPVHGWREGGSSSTPPARKRPAQQPKRNKAWRKSNGSNNNNNNNDKSVEEDLRVKLAAAQGKVQQLQGEVFSGKRREKQLGRKLDEKTLEAANLSKEAGRRKEKNSLLCGELGKVTDALDAIMNTLSACGAQWADQLGASTDEVASRMSRGVLSELLATNHEISEKLRQLNTLSRMVKE